MQRSSSQDTIQRLVLGTLLVVILVAAFTVFLVGPTRRRAERDAREKVEIDGRLAKVRKQIQRTDELNNELARLDADFQKLIAPLPTATPIAWFPPKMRAFFAHHGIEGCDTRPDRTSEIFEDVARLSWSIDLPGVDFLRLGRAIEELENSEPLLEITGVLVEAEPAPKPVEIQRANLRLRTIMRK